MKVINGKLREERLNENWFTSVPEAQEIIESWQLEYNRVVRTRVSAGKHRIWS